LTAKVEMEDAPASIGRRE